MEYVLRIIGVPTVSLKRAFAPLGNFVRHIHEHFIPQAGNNYHPHILGQRSLALMSGLLVAVKIFTLSVISFGPIAPAFSSAITQENIINLTNQSRSQFNLGTLKENSILSAAAQAKANDMLAKGYFAHTTPDGHTPWDFVTSAGYSYLMAGENLAVNFTEAENVEAAWMNSPGHKANIVNQNFEEIGIGISEGQYQGHTAIFVVQMFGTPAEQKITLSEKTTQVQKSTVPAPTPKPTSNVAAASQETIPVNSVKSQSDLNSQPKALGDNQNQNSPLPETPPLADGKNKSVAFSSGDAVSDKPMPNQEEVVLTQTVSVQHGNIQLSGENADIIAQVTGPAVKVIAYFGQQAIMLSPKDQYTWTGKVAAATLAGSNLSLKLKAFGMNGQTDQLQLAEFSKSTQDNYNLPGSTPSNNVSLFNRSFDPKSFESRFYLFFIAGLLSSLVLAIAVKRHIQHLSLIANSSFVAIFATLLFWAG